ncbi:hypothetical protein [Streptacidiphilus jiangxiensis]|uniref:Uncharacterized protein n=1 Tax=Streptacidiphilus jiangxiensis TaxID=235985 RepID=A0A1H7QYZ3_STRJI|nr:hypothetical protein [Streptacidiphilus jiangxiensis]SEL52875.1 hypothetical protein SAMN05414137_109278 [Streptacidiphilus jiangxiensis]
MELPDEDGDLGPCHFVLGVRACGDRTNGLPVRGSAGSRVLSAPRGAVSWAVTDGAAFGSRGPGGSGRGHPGHCSMAAPPSVSDRSTHLGAQ